MKCQKCGEVVRPGLHFCESCGTQVDKACAKCAASALPDARFCGTCGAAFSEDSDKSGAREGSSVAKRANASGDGERRQLTVLFADVVGSTALAGKMDPEALRDVLRAYQGICTDCVTRYGGNINQYIGDGVVAFFGYPAAHDNDAERAILAGLAVIEGVRTLDETLKAQGELGIEARVGIHTGLVVVGAMGAGGGNIEHAIGEAPNLAARIQGEAAPNTVCISAATLGLVGERFQVRALGARALKGVAKDTKLFSVVAAKERDPGQRGDRQTAPLVGREPELRHLLERWDLAQRGHGQAVYLSGEGGIGKSRLLAEFRELAAAQGNAWRNIFCSPFYQNSALHPIVDLIERAIRSEATGSPPDRALALRQVLRSAGIGDDTTYALIASLLGLRDDSALSDLAPAQRKRQTLDALIAWLRADAQRHPLVVVVEDLHWIDASTRELLGMLLERINELHMLVVFTFRPEFVPAWAVHGHLSALALTRLSSDQVVAVARGILAGKALPSRVIDEIVRRTDGIPLFVEELTKAIVASGLVVERDGELQLASGSAAQFEVPATLRDSLTARLDRLGAAKSIAQLASVLGREFDHRLLQAVCDFPEAALATQLAALNDAEIIQQSGVPPLARYVFKHALIQEAAYDGLLKSARLQYHQRVAQTYVAQFPDVTQLRPELVAHHFSRASMPEAAVFFWQQAGELAVARSGHEEAIAHLGAALEQIALMPDSEARATAELSLRVKIGPALVSRLGMHAEETGSNYNRACQLAETLGERPEHFVAMWGDWMYKTVTGQLVAASRRSEDLVSLSRKLNDDGYVLQAHHSRWTSFMYLGDCAKSRADTLQGIRLYDRTRHRQHRHLYGGHDPGACAHSFGANAAWATGHTQEAYGLAETAISIAQDLDHSMSLVTAYMWNAIVLHGARRFAATQVAAEQMIAIAEKHGFRQWLGIGLVLSGASRTAQGETDLGLKLIEEGLKTHRTAGQVGLFPLLGSVAAEAQLLVGNDASALELLAEAVEVSEKTLVGWHRPEIQRLQAEAMLHSGQVGREEAIVRVEDAVRLAKKQGAVALEWRATMSLARLLEKNGQPGRARKCLSRVCGAASEGLDSLELDESRSLLATLS
jgi:class 3 adenylate cyclase/predicted ATPase